MHHRNFSFGAVIQANQNRKRDNNINGASINFSHVVVLITRHLFCAIHEWLMVLHELHPLKVWLKDQIDRGKRI